LYKLSPARIIALGFATLILLGSVLLIMPFSVKDGVHLSYVDSLYTATSAVCVTGLVVVDAGDTFTPAGQAILAALIHIGGLGVTATGAGIILAIGKKMNLKGRTLIREAMNLNSGKGIVRFVRDIFVTTVIIELIGAILSFPVFVKDYPIHEAIGISLFHAIAAFNNAGFDILGNFQSLIPYSDNVLLNLVTCALILFGGIGFLCIKELWTYRLNWKKLSANSKIALSVTGALTAVGTLLLYITEDITLLGAFFSSISARTAGFSTFSFGEFTVPGLMVMMVLMFIGASSGSTGGGIKTGTFFVLLQGIKAAATNRSEKAFKRAVPKDAFHKAAVIALLGIALIFTSTFILTLTDPQVGFIDALFEMVSAFATVGLSTGITPGISLAGKLLSIIMMFIGRLGPLTIATLWYFTRGERIAYPETNIAIG